MGYAAFTTRLLVLRPKINFQARKIYSTFFLSLSLFRRVGIAKPDSSFVSNREIVNFALRANFFLSLFLLETEEFHYFSRARLVVSDSRGAKKEVSLEKGSIKVFGGRKKQWELCGDGHGFGRIRATLLSPEIHLPPLREIRCGFFFSKSEILLPAKPTELNRTSNSLYRFVVTTL